MQVYKGFKNINEDSNLGQGKRQTLWGRMLKITSKNTDP